MNSGEMTTNRQIVVLLQTVIILLMSDYQTLLRKNYSFAYIKKQTRLKYVSFSLKGFSI